jgi:tetratricopeptide (TPR) repeat protein
LTFQRKYRQITEEYDERKKKYNISTDDPALLLIVAKARIQYGDYAGALQDLAMAGENSDPQISLQKGICYESIKNWQKATLEFSKCISQMPTYAKAYYHRGICKLYGEDMTGESDINRAIELEPKFFDAYVTRATLYELTERYSKAISDCDYALHIEPTSIRAHLIRGTCRSKLGDNQLAISDFSKAISIERVKLVNSE